MLNTENAIENRDRHEDTWISVVFYAGYFYAQMLMFQKDYKGYKGLRHKNNGIFT